MASAPPTDTLCYGDCLDWMARWDDATVDLIYLDPPFNSNASYNVLYAADAARDAQYRAFNDTWSWDAAAGERLERYRSAVARPAHKTVVGLAGVLGESGMLAYLTYMAERLEHCCRLLKPTGSLYRHCDPTANAYLRALCDGIFGADRFRNEIVWRRTSSHNDSRKWAQIHDCLLFYAGPQFTWNPVHLPHDPKYVAKFYRFEDARGRYRLHEIIRTASMGPRPNLAYEYRGYTPKWGWRRIRSKVEALDRDGRIEWSQSGRPYLKRYLHEQPGPPVSSVVVDIPPLSGRTAERLGYPTQKPLALLKRIILVSSNKGDVVLDPFCGCGTTVEPARKLGRRWCGIDISAFAVDLVKDKRLRDPAIPTLGIPADLAGARKLASEDPFAFESWAVTRLPGFAPNIRQRGDGGLDGRATLAVAPDDADSRLALAQVKGGKFQLTHYRDFRHVLDREAAALGCFLTLDPAPPAPRAEAKTAGRLHVAGEPYDRLHLWSIADCFERRWPLLPVMADPYSGRPMDQPGLF